MRLGFDYHKNREEFAKAEIESLLGSSVKEKDGLFLADADFDPVLKRLAFCRAVYEIKDGEKKLLVDINKENSYGDRRAHLLPAGHPAMTHPRLARAMVNVIGAENEVLDPFCGAGGIMIEAGLCGLKVVGFDVDEEMLERAETNLDNFGIDNYVLKKQDATSFTGSYEAAATDLPYGKNTKVTDELENLYLDFLKNLKRNEIEKAVVGFPDTVDHRDLIKRAGLEVKEEFSYYLHKSLSKKIVLV